MQSSSAIVFPGLDGTDLLLGRFAELAPQSQPVSIVPLPDDPRDDYESLCTRFSDQIQKLESCHIIGESFSGPLGILLAHRFPEIVDRLTLVATFANSPTPAIARIIPWSILYRIPMPNFVAKRYFVGSEQPLADKLKFAIRRTSPGTLVKRMRCVMNVDVTSELSQLKCDIKYIRPKFDRLVPMRSLNTIVDTNPNVIAHEIEGPHLIMQTRPEQVWECISN